jgi:cobalt-zinc-cadmium efflux system membrane fusion protein
MNRALPTTLALLFLAGCGKAPEEGASQAPPGEVWLSPAQDREASIQTVSVEERPVGGVVQTVGRLTFDDRKVAHIFSPVSGRVTRLLADLGQRVKAGQALALLDSPDMGGALADYHKADAAFIAAEKDRDRQKELFEAHAGAQRDFEGAEAVYRSALAERDRAKQRADLFYGGGRGVSQGFQLRSPISGEVIARGATAGMEVQGQYAGTSVELYTVGELDALWLLADIPESDVFRVKAGSPLTFKVNGSTGAPFRGRIDWVSGTLDPSTRAARVRCEVPNPGRVLKPEMFAQVSIQVDRTRALAVPRTAVTRIGSITYAFVDLGRDPEGRHRFQRRPIAVDEQEAGDYVPVASGLKAGETVVSQGAILLAGL